jgi:hypothetical protein
MPLAGAPMVGQIFRKFGLQAKILAMVLAASLLRLLLKGFVNLALRTINLRKRAIAG